MVKDSTDKTKLEIGMIVANKIHEKYCQKLTKQQISDIKQETDAYIDKIISKDKKRGNKSI
jgi:hypothetical protein